MEYTLVLITMICCKLDVVQNACVGVCVEQACVAVFATTRARHTHDAPPENTSEGNGTDETSRARDFVLSSEPT